MTNNTTDVAEARLQGFFFIMTSTKFLDRFLKDFTFGISMEPKPERPRRLVALIGGLLLLLFNHVIQMFLYLAWFGKHAGR